MQRCFSLLFLPAMFVCNLLMAQQQKLTPELLWQIGRVGLDAVSPDGRYAVYGVQCYDVAQSINDRILYRVEVSSGETLALTETGKSASDASFHPDGKTIGFLRDGKLHEIPLSGGTPVLVSEETMNGYHYAPTGKMVLFTRDVKMDQTAAEQNPDLPKTTGRVIDGLMYRHWKSWHDYQYSNIFVADYAGGKLSGTPRNIMNEPFDAPLRPMGGMEQISWSPDGRFIAYACRKERGTAEALSTNADIYVHDLASGKTLNSSEGMQGYDLDPIWSPDGQYLAWTSQERAGYEADRTRIMLLDLKSGERRELTEGWTYEANHPQWAPDSKSLYLQSSTDFTYQLYQWPLTASTPRRITTGRHDYNVFRVADNNLVATRVAMDAPAELYRVDPANGDDKRLSFVTDAPWKDVAKGKIERRTVKTTDGKDMNVWVVFPPDFDPAKKYPALLYCQGGPQSALSQGFSYRWNFQMMASKGYVVVAPCRRGMPGSGQEWNDAIIGDWGGQPMQDLLSAIDDVSKEPYIDKDNLGAVGASYGGYSVYWLAGNHNKRFKTFISHCGLFNLESFYGTTEEVFFPMNDLGKPYWDTSNTETFEKFSPHRFVQNWDTPMLVIHNELDYRVPLGEGMQAFQAAQLKGLKSKFLYFPDEGHWVTKAQNSILWQRTFFGWLDETLQSERP